MNDKINKYLEDIKNAISEIDIALNDRGKNYNIFLEDFVFRKFIERNIEIIGEATNRILKINPEIPITSSRKIVDTRNYIIHAYDTLLPDILWSIVINHLPKLQSEVSSLLEERTN